MIDDFFVSLTRKVPTSSKDTTTFEYTKSYASTTINGYIGSRSYVEIQLGGKWTTKNAYKFFSDTECNYDDIIVYDSKNYRVVSDSQNTIDLDHHYKNYVEKIENVD